jgi:hypothetical protein
MRNPLLDVEILQDGDELSEVRAALRLGEFAVVVHIVEKVPVRHMLHHQIATLGVLERLEKMADGRVVERFEK